MVDSANALPNKFFQFDISALSLMHRSHAIASLLVGLMLPGCSRQSAQPIPDVTRNHLQAANANRQMPLPTTVRLNGAFLPQERDIVADIAGRQRFALDTLTRELFHGSLMETLAKDPPTLFAVPESITFKEASLVANMVVMQMRTHWSQPTSEEDPTRRYDRVLKKAISEVATSLKDPSTISALTTLGVDTEGMKIYVSVLQTRATTNDDGGDGVTKMREAVKQRLTPADRKVVVE
jgi:hypothetical protein